MRAVYTKELGIWDGDPVSLHPHPPVATAHRYVDLIGAEQILAEGRRAVEEGDYRWATQILHHLVFAQPDHHAARQLQADAYEQPGYQIEGPQWRGIYLGAALELREGVQPPPFETASPDTILAMPVGILFDFVAVHLNGPAAAGADLRIDLEFTDHGQTWTMWIKNGVLHARRARSSAAQLTISGPKAELVTTLLQPGTAEELAKEERITLTGDPTALTELAGLLDQFAPTFEVITPCRRT